MESRLIIGCKHCEKKLRNSKGFTFDDNGSVKLPFSIYTAFTKNDVEYLCKNHYTCDFCETTLKITSNLLKFINTFLDKQFHVSITDLVTEISNGEINISIPSNQNMRNIESTQQFLKEKGINLVNPPDGFLPTIEDLILIQNVMNEMDKDHWTLRIESAKALEPYLPSENIWLNYDEFE